MSTNTIKNWLCFRKTSPDNNRYLLRTRTILHLIRQKVVNLANKHDPRLQNKANRDQRSMRIARKIKISRESRLVDAVLYNLQAPFDHIFSIPLLYMSSLI